jgi:hypothetical protein
MRAPFVNRKSHAVLGLAALAAMLLVSAAEAAPRKHRNAPIVTVHPRSFLDAGTDVQVGSKSRYVSDSMPGQQAAQLYPGRVGGDQPLPERRLYRGVPVDIRAPAFLAK